MRSLLIALHDVTPAHAGAIEQLYTLLEEFGVRQYALFVVPNWHGEWPLSDNAGFVARLRERAGNGCEILLHGLRHDEVGARRTLGEQLRAAGRTAREAEFLPLADAAAEDRIKQGKAWLREVGLDPVGFVPPAWLYRPGLRTVLRTLGFSIMEDAWWLYDLASGRRVRAPAVQWSTRKAHRAVAGVVIARVRVPLERRRPLLRLAIHPPDIEHRRVSRSLRWTLERLLATRRPVSYREAIGAARADSPRNSA